MVKQSRATILTIVRSYFGNNSSQVFCIFVLLIVVLTTFVLQDKIVGWETGWDDLQPKHHGWVSANTLAIIIKATPENNFVGYALASVDNKGQFRYEYFDRYPIFFSAIFNRVLTLAGTLAEKIYLAKQIMNFIFLGTLVIAFLVLDKLTGNKPLSLTAVLLTFSNPYLLWYKDMVHFDQPALFGFLLLIYALALYKFDGLTTPLYISTFVAIGLGRGYASYSILILWLAFEAFMILKSSGLGWNEKLRNMLNHRSFHLLIIAITWGGSLLLYNVIVEAHKRDVSIFQTGILHSAKSRLSMSPEFNEKNEWMINWPDFTKSQVDRIIQWSFPFKKFEIGFLGDIIVLALIFTVIGIMTRKQTTDKKMIYFILMLSGFGWLFPLRSLAAMHDYTAMYYIGIPLVFFLSVFLIMNPSKKMTYFLLTLGLIFYGSSIAQVRDWHEERSDKENAYTYDFMEILKKIDGAGNYVNIAEPIPYGPFPPGFYLSEQYLSNKKMANYVISQDKNYLPDNLTPDNNIIFLFKK